MTRALTEGQERAAKLAAEGKTRADIMAELGISKQLASKWFNNARWQARVEVMQEPVEPSPAPVVGAVSQFSPPGRKIIASPERPPAGPEPPPEWQPSYPGQVEPWVSHGPERACVADDVAYARVRIPGVAGTGPGTTQLEGLEVRCRNPHCGWRFRSTDGRTSNDAACKHIEEQRFRP